MTDQRPRREPRALCLIYPSPPRAAWYSAPEMSIPPFQSFLLPALQLLGAGEVMTQTQMSDKLASHFELTSADRAELISSGTRRRYVDRTIWALVYLFHAGLAERPSRGRYRVSQSGIELLKSPPQGLSQKYLIDHYPSFREFARPGSDDGKKPPLPDPKVDAPPSERLESAIAEIRTALVAEILERLASLSPSGFERVVLRVLQAMGYAANDDGVRHTGQSGDEGIDGVIYQDPMGLDRVYVQAKNWANSVTGPDLSKFVGAMDLQGAAKGVFFTRSSFTAQAVSFADKSMKRIVLVDGQRLARLMIQYGVGAAPVQTYVVSRIDADFFDDTGD